jgi:hypothetical protein
VVAAQVAFSKVLLFTTLFLHVSGRVISGHLPCSETCFSGDRISLRGSEIERESYIFRFAVIFFSGLIDRPTSNHPLIQRHRKTWHAETKVTDLSSYKGSFNIDILSPGTAIPANVWNWIVGESGGWRCEVSFGGPNKSRVLVDVGDQFFLGTNWGCFLWFGAHS